MLNKKAQFYLVSIMIVISIFLGFATVANYGKRTEIFSLNDLSEELTIEKRYLLDYIFYNQLDESQIEDTFIDFSENYIKKIGNDKDIFFIFTIGENLSLYGNQITPTNFSIDYGLGYENLNEKGKFYNSYKKGDNFKIKIEEEEYIFEIRPGQNIYYLIHHLKNEERYIING
jgi:hypothetical protein